MPGNRKPAIGQCGHARHIPEVGRASTGQKFIADLFAGRIEHLGFDNNRCHIDGIRNIDPCDDEVAVRKTRYYWSLLRAFN